MSDGWTETQVSRLKTLWSTSLSAAQIAVDLGGGITRSAVIGKASRIKLPARRVVNIAQRAESKFNPPTNRPAALKKRPDPLPRRNQSNSLGGKLAIMATEPGIPEHLEEPAVGAGMQLIELENGNCRWPFGHPNSDHFYFCGADGADMNGKRPYCPFHTRKAQGETVNQRRFMGSALFAAGIKSATKGAHHG